MRGKGMKRSLLVTCLLISGASYSIDLGHTNYSQKPPTVHQQITNGVKNDRLSNIVNGVLSKIVPIVPSLVALGKFIANKIKNKKDNQQNNVDKMHDKKLAAMKQTLQQQRQQLKDLTTLYAHYCRQEMSPAYKKQLKQRSFTIKKLLQGKMGLTAYANHWFYTDEMFIQEFDCLSNATRIRKGVKFQHVLAKEFSAMGEKTENLWRCYYEDYYIQQLIERSVGCIKEGMACNESGDVVKASLFADIGWAILDHIQATGEGMYQGVVKIVDAFLHPIKLTQNGSNGTKQLVYSLGQVTIDVIDFYMLAIKNPVTAQKKLQIWQQSFVVLLNKINQEWHIKTSRDITKFIATFATERVATYGIYNVLGKVFMVARANAVNLAQKKEILVLQSQQMGSLKEVDEQQVVESLQDMPHPSIRCAMRRTQERRKNYCFFNRLKKVW